MSDAQKPKDDLLKPQDNHASSEEITTLDNHASGETLKPLDNHASSEEITTLDNHASIPVPK
jgi:hypothetical protein